MLLPSCHHILEEVPEEPPYRLTGKFHCTHYAQIYCCHFRTSVTSVVLYSFSQRRKYVRHILKTTGLKKQFDSTLDILDEMRLIHRIEHNGRAKSIIPLVGAQKDICKAFGLDIHEGCGTEYSSRKFAPKRRGYPAKAKTVKLDS